mgnify:CR=1 FL=1
MKNDQNDVFLRLRQIQAVADALSEQNAAESQRYAQANLKLADVVSTYAQAEQKLAELTSTNGDDDDDKHGWQSTLPDFEEHSTSDDIVRFRPAQTAADYADIKTGRQAHIVRFQKFEHIEKNAPT